MTSSPAGITLTIVAHDDVHLSIVRQKGDWGDAYQKKAAMVRLAKADTARLALKDGARVEINSSAGSVVVIAKSDAACVAGVGLMPSSLYTNRLVKYDPASSTLLGGHIDVQVVPTEKPLTPISDLKAGRRHA